MNNENAKLKLLYLMKIFYEKTDETHSITMSGILEALSHYEIEAERKSIYSDITRLCAFGMNIVGEKRGKEYYYSLKSKPFELAELKLLVDSVQAARFITEDKSNRLIKKIEGLASNYEASELQRQVYVSERVKSENEQILKSIDLLHSAVSKNREIHFKYFNWNTKKQMELRRGGALYKVSPWALTLADENYYLVAYDDEADQIKYFRVDKMLEIVLTDSPRKGKENFEAFDIAAYARKRFSMFDGEERSVKLYCKNSYAGVIIDRFGSDVLIHKSDEEHFTVNVKVAVSRQFISWVLSMHEGVRIVSPADLVAQVKNLLRDALNDYEQKEDK